MKLLLFIPFLCVGCAELSPSWRGFFVGTQAVSGFEHGTAGDDVSCYGTAIVGLGKRNSFQMQVANPLNRVGGTTWRIAVDRRIF